MGSLAALARTAFALAAVLACAGAPARETQGSHSGGRRSSAEPRALVLVSIDGFRSDYLEVHGAPHLARFAQEGVRAEALVPAFPTKTFPNHHTLVTGLWPEHHGVVGNAMYDPELDLEFRLGDPASVGDSRWWGGEPLWVGVERAGRVAAAMFWPGTEAEIAGVRPTFWFPYDVELAGAERVARVLAWFDLPPRERPAFVTLYFSEVDAAGHRFGPLSPEVGAAVLRVDQHLGALLDGLERRGLADAVDVVVLSDHGMRALEREQVIALDDYVDLAGVHIVTLSPVLGLRAPAERADELCAALRGAHPHLAVWPRGEVPEHLHYRDHARIPPVVGLADPGWTIALREDLPAGGEEVPARERASTPTVSTPAAPSADSAEASRGGSHGWDPRDPEMHAFFAARGPSFQRGLVVPPFENVHVYELLARVLGIDPAPNDGDPEALLHLLRETRAGRK